MPSNASLRLRRQFQDELNTREAAQARFRATVGDGAGNIEVPSKRNFIYIRRVGRSRVEECQNTRVPRRDGLPIIVGYDPDNPNTLQVLEPDWGGMPSPDSYPYVPFHHESHEFQNADGGDDITWIQKQQFVPLLVYPTDPPSMILGVYNGWYQYGGEWHFFEDTTTANLTGYLPAVGFSLYLLIYIDGATEALGYLAGAAFPVLLPPADIEDAMPLPPDGSVPLVAVYLNNGDTSIDWADLYDVRLMMVTTGPAGSGAAPSDAPFVTTALDPGLSDERVLAGGTDIGITDGGAGGNATVYRKGNVILRARADGVVMGEYPATDAGFRAALAACANYDTVLLPAQTITLNDIISIPNRVRVKGVGCGQKYAGASNTYSTRITWDNWITAGALMTLGIGSVLEDMEITWGTAGYGATLVLVDMPNDYAEIICCRLYLSAATGLNFSATTLYMHATGITVDLCTVELGGVGSPLADTALRLASGYIYRSYIRSPLESAVNATGGYLIDCRVYNSTGYGVHVTAGTPTAIGGFFYGLGNDIQLEGGTTLSVYASQYTTTGGAGALVYLPGDRTAVNHAHTGGVAGVTLDWDTCWADAVHDHSAAGEGGQLDWDTAFSDAVHTHESAAEGGEDITPDALGVNTPVPNQDGAIAQAEVAADPAAVAGVGMTYFKDDGGQTKEYFEDDTGNVFEKAGIVEDLTITVGAAGDFAVIQDSIDWLTSYIIKGDCIIEELDSAAYDEAVVFANLLLAPGATLTLKGDTRVLAGLSYVDGAEANEAALANGGSGICALSALGAVITVTGTVSNPDFDADGWIANDRLMVYSNAHAIAIYTISAVLNNTITLTVAAPAIGDDGTAIALVPNRSIDRSVAGPCVEIDGCRGIILDGWYLETGAGASCWGVYAHAGALTTLRNVLCYAEDICTYIGGVSTEVFASDGAVSMWGGTDGVNVQNGYIECYYLVAVGASNRGFYAAHGGKIVTYKAIATHCGASGYHALYTAYIYAYYCTARQCITTGYYAYGMAFIYAASTTARCNGNGANYNPTPSCTSGNCCAAISYS